MKSNWSKITHCSLYCRKLALKYTTHFYITNDANLLWILYIFLRVIPLFVCALQRGLLLNTVHEVENNKNICSDYIIVNRRDFTKTLRIGLHSLMLRRIIDKITKDNAFLIAWYHVNNYINWQVLAIQKFLLGPI